MRYCDTCHAAVEGMVCSGCGKRNLPEVKGSDYCFVTEKEEMWAKMFMNILQDQKIPYTSMPSFGAGLALKGGKMERLSVYVPYDQWERSKELLNEAFSNT